MEYYYNSFTIYRMSSTVNGCKKQGSWENKENVLGFEVSKKGKSDLKENNEWQNKIEVLEEDKIEGEMMDRKRKMKYQSIQNFSFELRKCETSENWH